jgi:hypothetical protein
MRELNSHEIGLVGGGDSSPPPTMGIGCFSAMVFLGISPFFGPGMVVGAIFNAISSCEDVDFTS